MVLISSRQLQSVLATRVVVVGRVSGVGGARHVGVLVQDDQSANHSRNPACDGEQEHNQHRAAALVHHSQRREDNR